MTRSFRTLRSAALAGSMLMMLGNTECPSDEENPGNPDGSTSGIPQVDFGDAPDGFPTRYTPDDGVALVGEFPSAFSTTGSRLGDPGAHADPSTDRLGPNASVERGVLDPEDADETENMVDDDLHDDGVVRVGALQGRGVYADVAVDLTRSTEDVPRYLNVAIDYDGNGRWEALEGGPVEHRVVNLLLDAPAGETTVVRLEDLWPSNGRREAWTRLVLSRTPIDVERFGAGGWDGSGDFGVGEVEDHLLLRPAYDLEYDGDIALASVATSALALVNTSVSDIVQLRGQAQSFVAVAASVATDVDVEVAAAVAAAESAGAAASAAGVSVTEANGHAAAAGNASASASSSATSVSSASASSGCAVADAYAGASASANASAAADAAASATTSAVASASASAAASTSAAAAVEASVEASAHAEAYATAVAAAGASVDLLLEVEVEAEAVAIAAAEAAALAVAYAEALAEATAVGGWASADAQTNLGLLVAAAAQVQVYAETVVSLRSSAAAHLETVSLAVTDADSAFASATLSSTVASGHASAAASASASAAASASSAETSKEFAESSATAVAESDSMAIALSTSACETEVCSTYIATTTVLTNDLSVCMNDVVGLDLALTQCGSDLSSCNGYLGQLSGDLQACQLGAQDCNDSLSNVGVAAIDAVMGDWTGADFTGMTLENADFTNANLQNANFTGANTNGCIWGGVANVAN